jgi:hypothetical protein
MIKFLQTALYPKNVPNVERIIRFLAGATLIALVVSGQGALGTLAGPALVLAVSTALVMIVTGFVGWCPMCALVGRKIKKG